MVGPGAHPGHLQVGVVSDEPVDSVGGDRRRLHESELSDVEHAPEALAVHWWRVALEISIGNALSDRRDALGRYAEAVAKERRVERGGDDVAGGLLGDGP